MGTYTGSNGVVNVAVLLAPRRSANIIWPTSPRAERKHNGRWDDSGPVFHQYKDEHGSLVLGSMFVGSGANQNDLGQYFVRMPFDFLCVVLSSEDKTRRDAGFARVVC